jgi:hypothetical protein
MTPKPVEPAEVARGLMLLGVLHIHALIATLDHFGDTANGRLAYLQIKLLAPNVAVFFALAGMSSRSLGAKAWPVVVQRSLMLVLLAWFSHVVGVVIQHTLWTPWPAALPLLKTLVRPLAYGIGHSTFVPWFLIVLAVARLFAYASARGWRWFFLALVGAVALLAAARAAGLPDNFYDWKRWPAAVVMFLIGMRLSPAWRVPHTVGLLGLSGALVLSIVNRPALWREGVCLHCDLLFIAQPMVGEFGSIPVYFVQQGLALIFLLWLSQQAAASPAKRLLATIGRQSIQLLVLHGWVILSFYGLMYYLLPRSAGAWVFVAIFAINVALHLALYRLLASPLNGCLGLCSTASRRLVSAARLALRQWRRAMSAWRSRAGGP